jgi:hypothetical protein
MVFFLERNERRERRNMQVRSEYFQKKKGGHTAMGGMVCVFWRTSKDLLCDEGGRKKVREGFIYPGRCGLKLEHVTVVLPVIYALFSHRIADPWFKKMEMVIHAITQYYAVYAFA